MDLGHILDSTPEPKQPMSLLAYNTQDTSGDYCLRVPMTLMQKELTDQVISSHYSDILKFFQMSNQPVMAESLHTLYTNLQLVASHPFLLVDHYLPRNLLLKEVPARLAQSSGKLAALASIIELIKHMRMNIALICRPGKSIDLIEAFLLGKQINYKRHWGTSLREQGPPDERYSTIHIVPSTSTDIKKMVPVLDGCRIDLIIAFDQTFDVHDESIRWLRHQNRIRPAPILRLVPANTTEHIVLSDHMKQIFNNISTFVNLDAEALRYLLAAAVVLRGKVGAMPSDMNMLYKHNFEPLRDWFTDPMSPWPLPRLPDIPVYSASDVELSLLTEVDINAANNIGSRVNGYSGSGGNMNDSVTAGNGTLNGNTGDVYIAKKLKRDTEYPSHDNTDTKELMVKDSLTHQLMTRMTELLDENFQLQQELESHRGMAADRQRVVEQLKEEMAEKIASIDALETRIRVADRKAERCQGDADRAKEKYESICQELEETRKVFSSDDKLADKQKLDEQRREINELKEELKRANEKIESRTSENEYMRNEYQKASNAAAESQAKIDELGKENRDLKSKLDLEIVKMKQLSFDNERSQKDALIGQLNSKLAILEEQLQRMMNAEKTVSGRRSAARAPSVPRNEKSQTPK